MNATILLILLQFSLFGSSGEPLAGAELSVTDAVNNNTVAFMQIGQTGSFEFTNLDAGNYHLVLKVPENTVKTVDRRTKHKFESDIITGYNPNKSAFLWQHPDGFVKVDLKRMARIADSLTPKFEALNIGTDYRNEEDETLFDKIAKKQKKDQNTIPMVIAEFTVVKNGGRISGDVESTSQRDFFKLMVGNDDEKFENTGKVIVLSRTE